MDEFLKCATLDDKIILLCASQQIYVKNRVPKFAVRFLYTYTGCSTIKHKEHKLQDKHPVIVQERRTARMDFAIV